MADVHSERWGMSTVQLGWKRTKVETRGLPTCVYRTLERIQSRVWDENRWTADDTPVVHCALTAESAPSSPNTTPVERSTCTANQNGGTSQRGQWEARIIFFFFWLCLFCLVFLGIAQSLKLLFLHWHMSQQKYWVSARAQTACCMSVTTVVFSTVGGVGRGGKRGAQSKGRMGGIQSTFSPPTC